MHISMSVHKGFEQQVASCFPLELLSPLKSNVTYAFNQSHPAGACAASKEANGAKKRQIHPCSPVSQRAACAALRLSAVLSESRSGCDKHAGLCRHFGVVLMLPFPPLRPPDASSQLLWGGFQL